MNIMHALHQLLNQPTHAGGPVFPDNDPLQARPGGTLMQGPHLGGRVQLQNTNNGDAMIQAVQNAGVGMQQIPGLAAPDAETGYMGGARGGNIGFPMAHMHHLQRLIHGGSPQGFPGAESFFTSPNMQQPMPIEPQGMANPGSETQIQDGPGMPAYLQSYRTPPRRTGNINF